MSPPRAPSGLGVVSYKTMPAVIPPRLTPDNRRLPRVTQETP